MNNHVFLIPVALILGIMIRISGDDQDPWLYLILAGVVFAGWQVAYLLGMELPHGY